MGIIRYILKKTWKNVKKNDDERLKKQISVSGAVFESDIPYLGDGNKMHQLNLYYPKSYHGQLPIIIDIHGGGWMYGDKELNQHYCEYLASQGYCVMGMSYRLIPVTDLQGMVQDIFESIHWLENHGKIRELDFSKVYLTGDSAGGHLATLVMCIQNSTKLQEIYQVKPFHFSFSAVAISNGVCEIRNIFAYIGKASNSVDKEMRKMFLGKRGQNAAWKDVMSFSNLLQEVSELPPLLIIGSETDVFYNQTQLLIQNLNTANIPYETLIWKKEDGLHLGHVFQISHWEWKESKITNNKMLKFFKSH